MHEFRTVCKADEIAVGQAKAFVIDQTSVAVFNVDGEFFALRDACPHAGASLALGTLTEDVVRCRIHHWGFCVRDGIYVDDANPHFNAKSVALRVVGDEIQVAVDAGQT